jgi:putative heme-binding domain-containing protein
MAAADIGRVHVHPTGIGRSIAQEALRLLLEQASQAEAPADGKPLEPWAEKALQLAVEQLALAGNQEDELFYLFILRNIDRGWTLDMRRTYFQALRHTRDYEGGDGMPGFISQIQREAVATLSDEERRQLGELTELAPDALDELPEPRPLVRKWTLDELTAELKGAPAGDGARGREVFHAALCSRCHRAGREGRPVGPELTSVSRRFSRQDLLRSILQPSDVVAEKYRQDLVLTSGGRRLTGIAQWGGDYRAPTLRLVTNPLRPAEFVEIPKQDIQQRQTSDVSPMPTGLLDSFRTQEIADLLEFLERGAKP